MPTNSAEYMREYMKRYTKEKGAVMIKCDVCDKEYKKYCKSKHNATKYHQAHITDPTGGSMNLSPSDIEKLKQLISLL